MHSGLDEEHEELRRGLRDALEGSDTVGVARAVTEGVEPARDPWQAAVGLGLPALLVPEAAGGLGLGEVELAVVAEELGRALAPVPFTGTAVAGATLLSASRAPDRLADLVAGRCRIAVADPAGGEVVATRGGHGWALSGAHPRVAGLVDADVVLVGVALEGHAPGVVAVAGDRPGVSRRPLPTLDATRPAGRLELADVVVGDADVVDPDAAARWALTRVRLLLAASAEAVGVGAAALDRGVAEARTHEQFGRPIGAFQAVAHPLAEAWAAVERSRSLVYAAAAAMASARPDAEHLVTCARVLAVPAARLAAETAIQVHGAIGYTWDHDLHLFLRRARAAEHEGTSTSQAEVAALAGALG